MARARKVVKGVRPRKVVAWRSWRDGEGGDSELAVERAARLRQIGCLGRRGSRRRGWVITVLSAPRMDEGCCGTSSVGSRSWSEVRDDVEHGCRELACVSLLECILEEADEVLGEDVEDMLVVFCLVGFEIDD
jgi:hypothetical protein